MQGSLEASVRAWIDEQGIWSWQKCSTADAYSILPDNDSPSKNLMLITGVYDEPQLPPALPRTNQGHNTAPVQPESYIVYSPGAGVQATGISSIQIGNNITANKPLNGTIGRFYFWGWVISSSEVWPLYQDPYGRSVKILEVKYPPAKIIIPAINAVNIINFLFFMLVFILISFALFANS